MNDIYSGAGIKKMNEEDLFIILNDDIFKGGEFNNAPSPGGSPTQITRLINVNYYDYNQALSNIDFDLDADSDEKEDPENMITRIEDVSIQCSDFIYENPTNIKDHYRIGSVIGSGTFAKIRLVIHKATG